MAFKRELSKACNQTENLEVTFYSSISESMLYTNSFYIFYTKNALIHNCKSNLTLYV